MEKYTLFTVHRVDKYYPQSWRKYLRQTLVFMQNGTLQKKFNFYFSRAFC